MVLFMLRQKFSLKNLLFSTVSQCFFHCNLPGVISMLSVSG